MKRFFIKAISTLFAIVLVVTSCPLLTSATVVSQSPTNGCCVRIRYAANGRYLDVPSEGINNNGTQLQIWDNAYGNQNQIFNLIDTGNGWKIFSLMSGKIIEVRDSSHEDYAQVAQWNNHNLACGRWDIISNGDGTVSFKNRESGKFLNVCGGGDAGNATKIIQYHDDGTVAMKFYLELMTYNDVLSATYDRNIQNSELKWTAYRPLTSNIVNETGMSYKNGKTYHYPSTSQGKILSSVEYLSPNTVANLIKSHSYSDSTWEKIEQAASGDLSEAGVAALLKELGFKDVPGLGTAIGIIQALLESRKTEEWNRFVDTAQADAQGRYSGIIIYTYYTFVNQPQWGPLNNGTTTYGWTYHIRKVASIEYKTWTGDNFESVRYLPVNAASGTWYYSFK